MYGSTQPKVWRVFESWIVDPLRYAYIALVMLQEFDLQ